MIRPHPPLWPRRRDWRIGVIGSGFVVRDCHLVAYQHAGFHVAAIASRNQATAREVASVRGVPHVHESVDGLLRDSNIEVVDIAVPPQVQPEIILRAVELGRGRLQGILAQKPLALSTKTANMLVASCREAGITLAVNQNMRYDQSVRAVKRELDEGRVGQVVLATIEMRAVPHWMHWARELNSLTTFIMSIHHLDCFRYWFGTPDRVVASTRTDPRTPFPHKDGINLFILEYNGGLRASAWDDVWAGPAEIGEKRHIRYRIEGTRGIAKGTIGWPHYPRREPSTLEIATLDEPDQWRRSDWSDAWFPDAFSGTMAQLLVALENQTEPEISGHDNLDTLALCEAVYAAATEHRVTTVREFRA